MRATRAALVAALALAACARGETSARSDAGDSAESAQASVEPGSSGYYATELPPTLPAPVLALAAHDGTRFDLAEQRGRAVLVFFGYTHCPDICPTTLSTWKRVKRGLGEDSARVRFVFVSVDPERDTADVAQRYAHQFDPSFVGLSGTRAQIDEVQRSFRISSFREEAPSDSAGGVGGHAGHGGDAYTVAHSARVFVFDPAGRWRLVMPASASAEATLADLKRLLRS